MRPLPFILLGVAGGATRLNGCIDVTCTDNYHLAYHQIDRRAGESVVTMTTTVARTITLDERPTDAPLLLQTNDAAIKKPAAEGGAPVGNGSPAPVTPPKSGATALSAHAAPLLLASLVLLFA